MPKVGCMIAAAALAVAGCASATPTPTPFEPTLIRTFDPATVPGLAAQTVADNSPGRHMFASYPAMPNALGMKLAATVADRTREFRRTTRPSTQPPIPELNLDWQLTAASGDVLGVRLNATEYTSAGSARQHIILWHDGRSRAAKDSSALVEGNLPELTERVRHQLEANGSNADPLLVRTDLKPDAALFDAIAFNARGELVVEFDDYQMSHGAAGRVAVAIPRDEGNPLLSDFGRRAQKAAAAEPPRLTLPTLPSVHNYAGVDCAVARCIALTFDDGPGPDTARLLDALASKNAHATFFTVGTNAATGPEVLQRMRTEGHEIGNHTWSHRDLSSLSQAGILDQIEHTQRSLKMRLGEAPRLLRPPYGAASPDIDAAARELGLPVIMWSVDTQDWRDRDPSTVAQRCIERVEPGSIVLLHDTERSTVDAVPRILDELSNKGFVFVTVSELYGNRPLSPGRRYSTGQNPL